jgi:hemin uptake protein HemP
MMRIIRIDICAPMKTKPTSAAPATTPTASGEPVDASARQPTLNSRVLFAGGREVVIFHYGESYRLRETRQGKLILTK